MQLGPLSPSLLSRRRGKLPSVALAALFALIASQPDATAQPQPEAAIACGGDELARGRLKSVTDGRDFLLGDGREVRLAAIEVPLPQAPGGTATAPGGEAAREALAATLSGADLVLRQAEYKTDRYGRLLAYVEVLRGETTALAQDTLVSAGLARVSDRVGSAACAAELLQRENAARKAALGLWGSPYYHVLQADRPTAVLAERGRFALVEGAVVSVHESGSTLYMNFGRHWSDDFTVTVRKRSERKFAAAGLDLKRLTDRRIRVRGFIEKRGTQGGPSIEAAEPEQIELASPE